MRAVLALLAVAAACSDDGDGPSRSECEAVIAHLVVLERADGVVDGPMCKYHSSCDGHERRAFLEACPHVLARRELRCYQRATTVRSADDCLPREVLDVRIRTGDRGGGYGASNFPDLGFRTDPGVGALGALPACERYLVAMEAYLACDQVPQSVRDSTRESVEYMRQSWADMATMPDDVRRATDDACAQAIDPVRQAAAAMGCTIP